MSTRAELAQACQQVAAHYRHRYGGQVQGAGRHEYLTRANLVAKAGSWLAHQDPPQTNAGEYQEVIQALQLSAFDWLSVEGAPGFAEWGHKLDEAVVVLHNMPRVFSAHAPRERPSQSRPRMGRAANTAFTAGVDLGAAPSQTVVARRVPRGPVHVPPPAETPVPMEYEADEVRDEEEI